MAIPIRFNILYISDKKLKIQINFRSKFQIEITEIL
jgi:hypothetical protein